MNDVDISSLNKNMGIISNFSRYHEKKMMPLLDEINVLNKFQRRSRSTLNSMLTKKQLFVYRKMKWNNQSQKSDNCTTIINKTYYDNNFSK